MVDSSRTEADSLVTHLRKRGFQEIFPQHDGSVKYGPFHLKARDATAFLFEGGRKRIFAITHNGVLAEWQFIDVEDPLQSRGGVRFIKDGPKKLRDIAKRLINVASAAQRARIAYLRTPGSDTAKRQERHGTLVRLYCERNALLEEMSGLINAVSIESHHQRYYSLRIGQSKGEFASYQMLLAALRMADVRGREALRGGDNGGGRPKVPKKLRTARQRYQSRLTQMIKSHDRLPDSPELYEQGVEELARRLQIGRDIIDQYLQSKSKMPKRVWLRKQVADRYPD